MLHRLAGRVRALLHRERANDQADEELQFHVAMECQANIARGMTPDEARRVALRDLGGLTQAREAIRGVRTVWLEAVWRDVRYAVGALRAAPGYTAITLAFWMLGMGATTAIVSVVDTAVFRPLPFPDSHGLVAVGGFAGDRAPLLPASASDFLAWREHADVFAGVAAVAPGDLTVKRDGVEEPEVLRGLRVTAGFFSVLRVAPRLGRALSSDDEVASRERVAVISHRLWTRRFHAADDILGRRLPGTQADLEIVGVMPPDFAYPVGARQPTDIWMPYVVPDSERVSGWNLYLRIVARLQDGVSPQHATTVLNALDTRARQTADRSAATGAVGVRGLQESLSGTARRWMLMLLGAVACLLLLVCVNIANLFLARVTARRHDLRIRLALGATRGALGRLLMAEGLLLSITGTVLGVLVSHWISESLTALLPPTVPRVADIAITIRVLAVMGVMALVTGVAVGLAPVLTLLEDTAAGLCANRPDGGRSGRPWFRGAFVVAQTALAVVLLVGAALFLTSFRQVLQVDLGFDYRDVLTAAVRPSSPPLNRESGIPPGNHAVGFMRVVDHVQRIPGVDIASAVSGGVPLGGSSSATEVTVPGRDLPPAERSINTSRITPDYFRALKVPLLTGRFFTTEDVNGGPPVMIINAAAAATYFGDQDPLGRRLDVDVPRVIVGVVGNVRSLGPEGDTMRESFLPMAQTASANATLVIRTNTDHTLTDQVKSAIWSEFPDAVVPMPRTLEQALGGLLAERRLNMLLLSVFGVLGLVVASAGVYGVMACTVAQRTPELSIRLALGASRGTIWRSVVMQASHYVALGLAIGVASAWAMAALVQSLLFEVQARDPIVFVIVVLVIATVGLAPAVVPARRAASLDPLRALRSD